MPANITASFANNADSADILFPAEWQALSDALDTSVGMLFLHDGKIAHLNRGLSGLLGIDAAELVGQPVESLLPTANADDIHVRLSGKSGRTVDFQRTVQRIDTLNGTNCAIWVLRPQPQTDNDNADHERWRAMVEHLPDPVMACAADTGLTYANRACRDLFGDARENPEGVRLVDLAHPEDRQKLALALEQAGGEPMPPATFRMRDRGGSWRHVEACWRELPAGAGGGLLLAARDMTEQYQQQHAVATGRKRQLHYMNRLFRLARQPQANFASTLKTILKTSAKALGAHRCAYWEFDEDPAAMRCVMAYDDIRQSLVNEPADPLFASSLHPLLHKVMLSEHAFVAADVDRDPRAALSCEYFHAANIKALIAVPLRHAGNRTGLLLLSESRQPCAWGEDEAELAHHAGELIVRIVGEREEAAAQAGNRAASGEAVLAEASAPLPGSADADRFAAFFIDLGDIGHVDESLGHAFGEELLDAIALRLKSVARKDDVLLRQDGGAFLLLARGLSDMRAAGDLARQIDETMRARFFLGEHALGVSANVGVALYPADGSDLDTLRRKAGRQRALGPGGPD